MNLKTATNIALAGVALYGVLMVAHYYGQYQEFTRNGASPAPWLMYWWGTHVLAHTALVTGWGIFLLTLRSKQS